MEFTVSKSAIESLLSKVQSVADSKATIPILASVRIVSNVPGITVSTTNLDRTIHGTLASTQLQIDEHGSLCAPARRLLDIVKSLPEGPVSFKKESNEWLTVKGVRGKFKIPSPNVESFPDTPDYSVANWIDVPSKIIKSLVEGTIFSISKNVNNININGALLEIGDGEIKMISTDGHRLSLVSAKLDEKDDGLSLDDSSVDIKVLLPYEAVGELNRLLSGAGETVSIAVDDNNAFFKIDSTVFSSRLSVGQFPNYQLIIPPSYDNSLSTDNLPFLDSLKRSEIIVNEDTTKAVKLSIKENTIQISSRQAEAGECDDEVECKLDGDDMDVGVNVGYLMEFLNLFKEEKIVIEFKDQNSQMLLHPETNNGTFFRYVLMPVRL